MQRGRENCQALRNESGSADECPLLLRMMLVRAHEVGAGQGVLFRLRCFDCLALDDKLLHRAQLGTSERPVLIGLREGSLNVGISPNGKFDSSVDG